MQDKAMRKVVDSNYLQDMRLDAFLSSNVNNYVVLTDYAAMEAYKGDTLKSIYKSMSIVSRFPNQVLILKSTRIVCGLKSSAKGMQKRLIDSSQTKDFNIFCKQLKRAEHGNTAYQAPLLEHGKAATEHIDSMLNDAAGIIDSISEISKEYSKEELKIFRTQTHPYTQDMIGKIKKHILIMSTSLIKNHPNASNKYNSVELGGSYIFRYSLCCYLLTLDWISHGGASGVNDKRIRNDIVDMTFVAYATFFDGLLTNDSKANVIYQEAKLILQRVSHA